MIGTLSCEKSGSKNLEQLNRTLKLENDSLRKVLKSSFDPIIINDNKHNIIMEKDTARFVVGLMLNTSSVIDSVKMNLKKKDQFDNFNFVRSDLVLPKKNDNTFGLSYFIIPNLKRGNYLYEGYLVLENKKLPIQHFFEVQ